MNFCAFKTVLGTEPWRVVAKGKSLVIQVPYITHCLSNHKLLRYSSKPNYCHFPITPSSDLDSLLTDINEELPLLNLKSTTKNIKINDWLKNKLSNSLITNNDHNNLQTIKIDTTQLDSHTDTLSLQIEATKLDLSTLDKTHTRLSAVSALAAGVVRWSLMGYISAQLGLVVVLTYQLGWDMMEPIAFLLTLSNSIVFFGMGVVRKREFTLKGWEALIRDWVYRRLAERRGLKFDFLKAKKLHFSRLVKQKKRLSVE